MVQIGRIKVSGTTAKDGELAISVVRRIASLSQNQAKRLFSLGKVYAGTTPCLDWKTRLPRGTRVSIDTDRKRVSRLYILDEDRILYLDSTLVVVNKPPGIVSVPPTRTGEPTLLNLLAQHLASLPGAPVPVPLHRLDMETSGLMLFGLKGSRLAELRRQVSSHALRRGYYAVVHGVMKSCVLSGDIDVTRTRVVRRNPATSAQTVVHSNERKRLVRYAKTQVVSLRTNGTLTLVQLWPHTGRYHQLRIQLSNAGHPIVGEQQHVLPSWKMNHPGGPLRRKPRLALQSFYLALTHPETGKDLEWSLSLDPFLEELLSNT